MLDRLEWMYFTFLLVDCLFLLSSVFLYTAFVLDFLSYGRSMTELWHILYAQPSYGHILYGRGWSDPRGYISYEFLIRKPIMNVCMFSFHGLVSNPVVLFHYGHHMCIFWVSLFVYFALGLVPRILMGYSLDVVSWFCGFFCSTVVLFMWGEVFFMLSLLV